MPRVEDGTRLCWDIVARTTAREVSSTTGQTGSGQAVCVACNTPAPADYVKEMAVAGQMGESLAAVVAALPPKKPRRKKRKKYTSRRIRYGRLQVTRSNARLAELVADLGFARLDESLQGKLRDQLPAYGFETYGELFTRRQLLVLFTLVKHIRRAHREMLDQGLAEDRARAMDDLFCNGI